MSLAKRCVVVLLASLSVEMGMPGVNGLMLKMGRGEAKAAEASNLTGEEEWMKQMKKLMTGPQCVDNQHPFLKRNECVEKFRLAAQSHYSRFIRSRDMEKQAEEQSRILKWLNDVEVVDWVRTGEFKTPEQRAAGDRKIEAVKRAFKEIVMQFGEAERRDFPEFVAYPKERKDLIDWLRTNAACVDFSKVLETTDLKKTNRVHGEDSETFV
jgi:hypothetical protein